jgi:uncharacterized protein YecE (DUF72 family)
MGRARIGVSGWSYDKWRETFYPKGLPKKRQLEHIGSAFDTVEANGPFYSLLSPRAYRTWYDQTPKDFRFAVKGSRFITHNKKLADVQTPLANFFASGVLALEEKLGPFLWQLSGSQTFDADRLASFLQLLPRSTEEAGRLARKHDRRVKDPLTRAQTQRQLRHAVEPRHESFFTEEAVRILRDAGVALAASHSADWPLVEEVTAGFVYIRLHGSPHTYASRYSDRALDAWADKISAWLRGKDPRDANRITQRALPRRKSYDVYIYFDNDAHGHAPNDALRLRERMERKAGTQRSESRKAA